MLAAIALAGCATVPAPHPAGGVARAALGQRVYVDGPYVTPLAVLEDSRCPASVQCVWAGQVRLSMKIELGSRSEIREIATQEPIEVADGKLTLVEVQPARRTPDAIPPTAYRFGFTFAGGL
jgi:hypothetical protein